MPQNDQQLWFGLDTENLYEGWFEIKKNIISDRGSKYSVVWIPVVDASDVKKAFAELKRESYFRKATHNSYAYRVKNEQGSIIEGKNDDGETGAGMCILRELQREQVYGIMLVVTRYFWGVQLHWDRFRHVVDAAKMFFKEL